MTGRTVIPCQGYPLVGRYEVTGVTMSGRRFKVRTTNAMHAFGINLYRGTVWNVTDAGRQIIKRVWTS